MFPRSPFADDNFISYARKDTTTYATGLADELTKRGFSCFIDRLGAEPSPVVSKSLKRKLKNCGLMVVIGTKWSGTRVSIKEEIIEFKKTGRPIIPIDIDGSIYDAIWYHDIEGIPPEAELNPAALTDGNPSSSVISRIEKAFKYRKRNARLRSWTIATAVMLLTLIGISFFTGTKAITEVARAAQASEAASNASRQAADANKQAADADRQAQVSKNEASVARSETVKAQGEYAKAQNNLTVAQNNLTKAKNDVAKAQKDLVDAQNKVAQADAELTKAKGDLEKAREETKKQIALADAATQEAKRGTVRFYNERGRQTLLNGNPEGALVYLNRAYQMIHDGTGPADYPRQNALNFLLSWSSWFLSGEVASLNGHQNRVTSGKFSPDGKRVITLSDDGSAKVWNSSDGKLLGTLATDYFPNPVMLDAYFSPDGKRIFTTLGYIEKPDTRQDDPEGKIVGLLWDGQTYEWIYPTDGEYLLDDEGDIPVKLWSSTPKPCFSADSSRFDLTLYDDSKPKVFSSKDGEEIEDGPKACTDTKVARKGSWVERSVVSVTDTSTGKEVEYDTRETHIRKIIFDPAVSKFVTVFGQDGFDKNVPATTASNVAKLWDATSGRFIVALDAHKDAINDAVFSADGTLLLTASNDGTAKIWNVLTGSLMGSLEGHRDALLSGVFSDDGKRVLTFGEDNRAVIWEWQKALRPGRTTAKIGGRTAAFSADGDRVIASDGKQVSSWAVGPGSSPSSIALPAGVEAVTVTPNGERVIVREGGELKLFNVKTGQRVGDLLVKEPAIVAFSQNSKYVVIASNAGHNIVKSMSVEVWETESGRLKPAEPPQEGPTGIGTVGDVTTGVTVAVNSAGTRVFGYAEYRRETWISPWDDSTLPDHFTTEATEHKGMVTLAAFTPDDKYLLTASDDKTIKIWRDGPKKGVKLVRTLTGHTGNITSIKFSADNQRIATTSVDGTAKVWDLKTGTLIASCEGHRGRVNAVEFSRDGERLVTIGDDGTLRVWDSRTGDLLATIQAHTGAANAMSYSSKQDLVVTTGVDGVVGIWDVSYAVLDPKQLATRVASITSLQIVNDQLIPIAKKDSP